MTPDDIKRIRLKVKLTQEGFADVLGMGIASIKRYELGHVKPTRFFTRLFRIIDAHPEILAYFKDDMEEHE